MKREEFYRLQYELGNKTETEKKVVQEVNEFLGNNYIRVHTKHKQYLHMENNSLFSITSGRDPCQNEAVWIEVEPPEAKVPKELSNLLEEKGFEKIEGYSE